MKELMGIYKKRRNEIRQRLMDFKKNYEKDDRHIFSELCFCILTPQAKATVCDGAVKELKKRDLLFNGALNSIRPKLKGVRFPNNKSKFLIYARALFKKNGNFKIKDFIDKSDVFKTRDWLVKNVKGIGYKEASHFLRNIGLGKDLAILDTHILKNLKDYGVIAKIPNPLNKKEYLKIEERIRQFSKKTNIPMDELDLLFWSKETGFVFK